ncbi:MAG TPA: hypothetical protein VGP43_08110 [Chitinophagaceae bacterium]|nr:hypothetical protein [Chitinophagaceae bacterium]
MKMTIKKAMISIAFIGVLTLGIISSASARFWGWETTSTTDWADGNCSYRETCQVHYILWIGGTEHCETVTIGCINQQ